MLGGTVFVFRLDGGLSSHQLRSPHDGVKAQDSIEWRAEAQIKATRPP